MTYKVEISPTAIADIEQIFLWVQEYSVDTAHRWVRGCYEIMLTLEKFPNRCPMSPESEYMGIEVRQLLYKEQFRILFTVGLTHLLRENKTLRLQPKRRNDGNTLSVRKSCTVSETSEEDKGIVRIHRIRHGSQKRLGHPEQLLDDDDE